MDILNFKHFFPFLKRNTGRIPCYLLFISCFFTTYFYGQSRFIFPHDKKYETIKFELSGNLIVVPVEVNGAKLSFILDSGVSYPIIFNLAKNDSLEIKNVSEIMLKGLGGGKPIRAYRSTNNKFKIGDIQNFNQHLYVVLDEKINFSPKLGFPVHGIIGYEFFKDFIVDINYISKKLKIYKLNEYNYEKCKKCEVLDFQMIDNKPFINASALLRNVETPNLKLLIDSGSSDALWLFEDNKGLVVPEENFDDFLGFGLSGFVFGKRARLDELRIGKYTLKDVKVAFPDSTSTKHIGTIKDRNGSIGGEILKRFRVVFDYSSKKISFKKNGDFKKAFDFNLSGIQLEHHGSRFVKELDESYNQLETTIETENKTGRIRIYSLGRYKLSMYPAFKIVEIRKQSPADLSGLRIGDVIVSVNGKSSHMHSLEEVIHMINDEPDKTIQLVIERNGQFRRFSFILKRVL